MNLPALSIRRHVLAIMLNAVIVLFGAVGFRELGVDRMPHIDFPMISVTTLMVGADPAVMDANITNIIETAVNSIPGIEHIQSTSSPGLSLVAVKFALEKGVDVAFTEVQAKVNQVLRELPEAADPPVVAKIEVGAAPIVWLALEGDRTLQQLNLLARNLVKKRLETIAGVGEVRIGGERERTIRIDLQPERMAAFGVTTQDLLAAFRNEHFQLPGGFLGGSRDEGLIKLDLEYHSLEELRRLVVAEREGVTVRLAQVARVEDGLADERRLARFNGRPAVALGVVKVTGANTVAVASAVEERLQREIIPQLPPGVSIQVAANDGDFIREKILGLMEHLALGTLFAALVVWFFLRSFRSTLIVAAAIPVSLLAAVVMMYFAGYTFNTMTLLAMLLLIGVVVDDAIVVLENIFRQMEEGESDPVQAALLGSEQVVFAVVAATLTLASIFAPVIFLGGIIGRFFRPFAMVVTCGVMASLLVSLTLTPMLCSRYLRVKPRHGRVYGWLSVGLAAMDRYYIGVLDRGLRHRLVVVVVTLLVVSSSGWFLGRIGKDFLPEEDEGRFQVSFRAPLGSGIAYTGERLAAVEGVLRRHEREVAGYLSTVGEGMTRQVEQGVVDIRMTPLATGRMRQYHLIPRLREELSGLPGVKAFPSAPSLVGGQRGEPLQFVLTGPELVRTARLGQELQRELAQFPELGEVDLTLDLDLPQYRLVVDRARSAELGVAVRDLAQAVMVAAGGVDVAKYNDEPGDGERYDIRIKAVPGTLQSMSDLDHLFLRSKGGEPVRLDALARFERELGASVISRFDLQYAAMFFANPAIPLGAAVERVMAVAKGRLPIGYQVKMTGRAEEFGKTANYMKFTFLMAIGLVFMVLASQFNSLIQPLVVMTAQPLAIIGGVAALWGWGHSLNIYSMVGLVLLMGLVAKNSILLVDLANQLRREGRGVDEALRMACPVRMRPVVMTSLTVILAMLPAALGSGAGSDTNGPLAVAVIGGMVSSNLLTLVVVPAVYSLVEGGLERGRGWWAARGGS